MYRLLLMLSLVLLASCKKDEANPDTLLGKWKLIEIYQGYAMGGCFCWNQVPSLNADILEFYITGKYKLTKSVVSSSTGCSGNYRVLSDTTIALTYNCQVDPNQEFTRKYSRSANEFIIDYQGIEGVIRYKYMRN
jgi:hypothetical protein